jgi:formylglycine-generating enzyme required for sulfatase activity
MEPPPGYLKRRGYRLPTEAEWEYACRAETVTSRFFGATDALLKEYAWYLNTGQVEPTQPVGQLKPNDLGLFDMYGNVNERCLERWAPHPQEPKGQVRVDDESPRPSAAGVQSFVIRGGGVSSNAPHARSAFRMAYRPSTRNYARGFRVARTYPDD